MLSRGQVEIAEREMNALTARINETFPRSKGNPKGFEQWNAATATFRAYHHPVFELWNPEILASIRAGDRNSIEGALAFLEADPHFFRSGYLKEKVLHALKRASWQTRDGTRLKMIILRAVEGRFKREFKFYARLIPRLRDAQFEAELRAAAWRSRYSNHARLVTIALDSRP